MTEKKYDPKLRQAMGEIENILKKYDCMAAISLHSLTHSEFKLHLESSWSLIEFQMNSDHTARVRVKIRPKMQVEMDATIGAVYSIRDLSGLFFRQMDAIASEVERKSDVTHTPFSGGIDNSGRDLS
jgi:hypothetical protein